MYDPAMVIIILTIYSNNEFVIFSEFFLFTFVTKLAQ